MPISELKTIGRIVGLHGQRADLYTDNGVVDAIIRGKVKYGETDESPIAVGDFVEYSFKNPNMATIEKIQPRKSVISRPAVEKKDYTQVLVSNVDRFIIVTSVAQPPFKSGLVDRFLVIAFKEKIHPVIVMNKIDLGKADSFIRYLDAWQKLSSDIVHTSAKSGQGIDRLLPFLKMGTSVIVGHSGVGKSSLINRINPVLDIKTKAISTYSGRGTHTTSSSIIYRLFPDGWVADTPGLKDLGLAGVSKLNLYRYFPEFEQYETECQFSNCIHVNEPGCGFKNALARNYSGIAEFRYDSYLNMLSSLKS